MAKWLESKEGITVILRYSPAMARAYQNYLDDASRRLPLRPDFNFYDWYVRHVWLSPEGPYLVPNKNDKVD